ncbi:hypothetical protein C162_29271, partial [Paenibacillus sp. FSL R7-269]
DADTNTDGRTNADTDADTNTDGRTNADTDTDTDGRTNASANIAAVQFPSSAYADSDNWIYREQ